MLSCRESFYIYVHSNMGWTCGAIAVTDHYEAGPASLSYMGDYSTPFQKATRKMPTGDHRCGTFSSKTFPRKKVCSLNGLVLICRNEVAQPTIARPVLHDRIVGGTECSRLNGPKFSHKFCIGVFMGWTIAKREKKDNFVLHKNVSRPHAFSTGFWLEAVRVLPSEET